MKSDHGADEGNEREVERAQRFDLVNPYWEKFLDEAGLDMTGARGDGCYIETADGRALLDCLAGFGTANLGTRTSRCSRVLPMRCSARR
ncbi:hypothetical protein PPGU19_017140 [Paraburkholderia sp. PGU19]|uniref:hypothetical protein n=1 Tax=Paraburkholderia sp. PGU19 TaxID=2735434 RepID=UPI0015DC255B|nr:hypothetical protein [Paraburkholderia sp. PGU19]BCF97145.1 hypothetical protein PPGU19_017140 [Paraburkholderia sp. PGU19]